MCLITVHVRCTALNTKYICSLQNDRVKATTEYLSESEDNLKAGNSGKIKLKSNYYLIIMILILIYLSISYERDDYLDV